MVVVVCTMEAVLSEATKNVPGSCPSSDGAAPNV
jgi:hypothetical protein